MMFQFVVVKVNVNVASGVVIPSAIFNVLLIATLAFVSPVPALQLPLHHHLSQQS